MSGWYAQDCARWDRTRQRLLAHGPLDEEDARNDLLCRESLTRLWIATGGKQGERWLGRGAFARRWGWTEREVRTLISRDDWHDAANPVSAAALASTVARAQPMDIAGSAPGQRRVSAGSAPGGTPTNAEDSSESAGSAPGQRRVSAGSPAIRADQFPQGSQDHKITTEADLAPADAAPPAAPAQPLVSPEAQSSPPPAPPATTPRPTKPSKAPKPEPRACPGYSEAIALWTRLHREAFPGVQVYPWIFTGPNADGGRVKAWLAAVKVGPEATTERIAEGLLALETGMRAYLGRAAMGTAFPRGEPGTTKFFTSGLSTWLQTDPDADTGPPQTGRGPPGKPDPIAMTRRGFALYDQMKTQQREQNGQP